jgi:hypothetical protein
VSDHPQHHQNRASATPRRRLPVAGVGPRTGAPARSSLVAALFAVALAGWLGATATLVLAADDVAHGRPFAEPVVVAVHLVTVVVLPCAVTAAVLHLLPVMLRNDLRRPSVLGALPLLLGAGFLVAGGVGLEAGWVAWPAAALVAAGLALVVWQLGGLLLGAPRNRMVVVSRTGVALVCLHTTAALVLGMLLLARGDRALAGITHERLVLIHLHVAVVGWLALLILTVGRTLIPMLAQAPAAHRRTLPVDELTLTAGLWLLLAGLALPSRPLDAIAGAVIGVAVARFGRLVARTLGTRHQRDVEAPLGHVAAGILFAAQAATIGAATLAGAVDTTRGAESYVILLLLGWAVGITLGHAGKLLSLSVWAAWPAGPRPKQHELYPRRAWQAETLAFAVAVQGLAVAPLIQSRMLALGASLVLVAAAVTAAVATATSWTRRPRLQHAGSEASDPLP